MKRLDGGGGAVNSLCIPPQYGVPSSGKAVPPFLAMDLLSILARERGIQRPWVYMCIGQVVAISYAAGLYFATCETAPPPKRTIVRSSRTLAFTTILATTATYFLEWSLSTNYFLPLLLVIHILLLLPLFESCNPASETSISIKQLYFINAVLAIILHWRNIVFIGHVGTWSSMYKVIGEHHAMSSIGWDIVCCAVIEAFALERTESLMMAPITSLGGVAGVFRGIGF